MLEWQDLRTEMAYYPVHQFFPAPALLLLLENRNLKVVPISVKYNLKFICISETFFFPTEFGVVQEKDGDGEAVRPAPALHCRISSLPHVRHSCHRHLAPFFDLLGVVELAICSIAGWDREDGKRPSSTLLANCPKYTPLICNTTEPEIITCYGIREMG